jgi:UDP-N-acetylmuramoylalanine--D-glutamate ligase
MMHPPDLAGRRIAILGAGREGRAALAWLRARAAGAEITIIAEQAPEAGFGAALRPRERLLVEPLDSARLLEFDLLIRSPGISPYREPLQVAREHGAQFTTPSSLWFATHPQARTVCITGTKGKSTTSALTAHLLRACGLRVQLAGNIGQPLLACAEDACDWWVIELSSYQIADLVASPTIAVILNLASEHLDWHGSAEAYIADKLRLAELTRAGTLILNASDPELAGRFAGRAGLVWFGAEAGIHVTAGGVYDAAYLLPVAVPESLPGRHNQMNVAAALSVVRATGADLRSAATAVRDFTALPHRLQLLGTRHGISFIDDSIASNPVATAAALEALAGRAVVLIVGGFDRGIDWGRYLPDFRRFAPRAVFGLPDNGERIIECLRAGGVVCSGGLHVVPSLEEAMNRACAAARPGDTVLLSPGAPSFPRFADYRERGRAFARLAGFSPNDG